MTYYLLVEPTMGETEDAPGGLFRVRDGLIEIFAGPDQWEDASDYLAGYVWEGESGAIPIEESLAMTFIDSYPWEGIRGSQD